MRIGQSPNAFGVGQIFVDLADKFVLVVEQKRLGAIKERQMHVRKHLDRARELADGEMRIYLAIDLDPFCIDLRTIRRDKVHFVDHGRKELA